MAKTAKAAAGSGAEHGSRIITALEAAWGAVRERHPEVPAVVVITGSGEHQKGTPHGYRLRGHHWPERWVTGDEDGQRVPELFVAGELLDDGGRAVLEVMLHEAAHALAAIRGIKDTSAAGNRYHNKRFGGLAAELGLSVPERPHKILGWSDCLITDETAAAYTDAIEAIGSARLPYLTELPIVGGGGTGGGDDGQGDGGDDPEKPEKRDGRRVAVVCACQPTPRRIQLTPKAIEDGPVLCGLCGEPFEPPEAEDSGQ